jgi:hypothetical protein
MSDRDFSNVQIATTESLAMQRRQHEDATAALAMSMPATSPEMAREIAKVQAALLIAAARPRDEMKVWNAVKRACSRTQLAEQASYAYKRGTSMIEGPTIRIAEALAAAYGNIDYGFDVIAQRAGESEVEAYCFDKEANMMVRRKFIVRHVRDLQGGSAELTAERDKYEMVANQAQRRVRACILEVLPGDLVDFAMAECQRTLKRGDGRPLAERVQSMLDSFAELNIGVGPQQIETLLQHPITAITEAEIPRLRAVYQSLKTGMARPEELFAPRAATQAPAKAATPAPEPQHDPQTGEVPRPEAFTMTEEEKAEAELMEREEAEREAEAERAALQNEGRGGFGLRATEKQGKSRKGQ